MLQVKDLYTFYSAPWFKYNLFAQHQQFYDGFQQSISNRKNTFSGKVKVISLYCFANVKKKDYYFFTILFTRFQPLVILVVDTQYDWHMASSSEEDLLLIMPAVWHKKSSGSLYLMGERIAWMADTKSVFTISHNYIDIKSRYCCNNYNYHCFLTFNFL